MDKVLNCVLLNGIKYIIYLKKLKNDFKKCTKIY